MRSIPLSRPYVTDETLEAVTKVIRSGNFILGEECRAFENELANYFGVRSAILVRSGTAALYLSLRALGVSEGDEVLVPSHTAFPTVEAIMHPSVKGVPVFVDIADNDYTLDVSSLEGKLTDKTKAIVPVHLYGLPARMDEILKFADEHNLLVVEDACQAHGAVYKGKKVGSLGDAAALSFYPSKNLGLYGDGGAILTNEEELAACIKMLRNHGREKRYEHDEIGDNLRFDEIQAAVGRVQLRNLDSFVARRLTLAEEYDDYLSDTPLVLPFSYEAEGRICAYHLYVVQARNKEERDSLRRFLAESGIDTEIHYPIPVHRQKATLKYFDSIGREINDDLPRTSGVVDRILSLPICPELNLGELDYIFTKVRDFYKL